MEENEKGKRSLCGIEPLQFDRGAEEVGRGSIDKAGRCIGESVKRSGKVLGGLHENV